jgi:hypothetical protein
MQQHAGIRLRSAGGSTAYCVSFLDPAIESWDINLATFRMEIVLNRDVAAGRVLTFEATHLAGNPSLLIFALLLHIVGAIIDGITRLWAARAN